MSFILGLFIGVIFGFVLFCVLASSSSDDAFAEGYRIGLEQAAVNKQKESDLNDESRS